MLGALASFALVIFGGIYLAANPTLYRDGFVKLVPPRLQSNVKATIDAAAEALKLWLGGQLIAMALVGVLTGLGLWLAGVPSALALGLIAGLAEFVPVVGPITAAVPTVLIAGAQDWQTLLWAIGVLVAVQQVESYLIMPLIAKRTVSVAPAALSIAFPRLVAPVPGIRERTSTCISEPETAPASVVSAALSIVSEPPLSSTERTPVESLAIVTRRALASTPPPVTFRGAGTVRTSTWTSEPETAPARVER